MRGTTSRALVEMLREAGAAEVHLRVSSPPVPVALLLRHGHRRRRASCIAANLTVDEIRDYLNVDTLAYLTLDRLIEATGAVGAGFCDACFTGDYPVDGPGRR